MDVFYTKKFIGSICQFVGLEKIESPRGWTNEIICRSRGGFMTQFVDPRGEFCLATFPFIPYFSVIHTYSSDFTVGLQGDHSTNDTNYIYE